MDKPTVLVTGASGFVGKALCAQLVAQGYPTIGVYRKSNPPEDTDSSGVEAFLIDQLDDQTDWSEVLSQCDIVIHLAARVHQMNDTATDPLADFRRVNTAGTLNLADQAAKHDVRQFIFLSSIGVNGSSTPIDRPFTEEDTPKPYTPYTVSKHEAEIGLQELSDKSSLSTTIIRPPLVYGPNNPGNLLRLFKLVDSGLPLPFSSVKNKKSFIGIDNLVSSLIATIGHEKAMNQSFLVTDEQQISLPELLKIIAKGLDKKSLLLPFPMAPLYFMTGIIGKEGPLRQLTDSLVIDNSKIKQELGWNAVRDVDDGLLEAAKHYKENKEN